MPVIPQILPVRLPFPIRYFRIVRWLSAFGLRECPQQQLQSVMAAFGDSEVLRPAPREGPPPPEGSKGEQLNDALAEHRALTEMQQRLTARTWDDGPRLLRGVAGSGKTVVLATQAARMIERLHKGQADLLEPDAQPFPVLAVCFNRTLVPFIRQRIELAYKQRTEEELPQKSLLVTHFNTLLYYLHRRGYCGYYRVSEISDADERASRYLSDLKSATGEQGEQLGRGLFHSVYIDEGQDFHEQDYRILLQLCARSASGQPRMSVFYDDAQNLYGRQRPIWSDLGLEVRGGRSVVMDECFRNTRQIVEPAFNVLLGVHANDPQSVRTRGFADTQTLKEKNLIESQDRHLKVHFTHREGNAPAFQVCNTHQAEVERLASRCEQLINRDGLLPQDILVLTYKRSRASELSEAISQRLGADRVCRPYEENEKDQLAIQPEKIAVSTVASIKGYDAPYVFVVSLDDFSDDVEGRASFYVACTRARDWLNVSAAGETELVREFDRAFVAANK
ncbi:MAG: AAA family ATPase [Rhodobacteraceae bacterium]|nr:AAA family ATPase [Paracoccaceae bacterium]